MTTAVVKAENSKCNFKHCAIVVKNGKILATGVNFYRNELSDQIPSDCLSVHAEVAAISKVSAENLKGATVYVARKGRCSFHAMSRPCHRCYQALINAGVKKVIYTD